MNHRIGQQRYNTFSLHIRLPKLKVFRSRTGKKDLGRLVLSVHKWGYKSLCFKNICPYPLK
jgi:hypothetical protein